MYLTKKDIIEIKDFIEDKEVSDGFIELYKYAESDIQEIEYEIRDNLIGAKKPGERLRFYVNKGKDGNWYFKAADQFRHEFKISELDTYKEEIDKANNYFSNNQQRIKLKEKEVDNGEFSIERSVNVKTGTLTVSIKNLNINETEKVIEELKTLKDKGIKKVDIRIYSK